MTDGFDDYSCILYGDSYVERFYVKGDVDFVSEMVVKSIESS